MGMWDDEFPFLQDVDNKVCLDRRSCIYNAVKSKKKVQFRETICWLQKIRLNENLINVNYSFWGNHTRIQPHTYKDIYIIALVSIFRVLWNI